MKKNHLPGALNRFSLVIAVPVVAFNLSTGIAFALDGDGSGTIIAPSTSENSQSGNQNTVAPGSWQAQYASAIVLIKEKKYEDAFKLLASIDQPGNANILNNMGFTSRKMGHMEDAQRYYEAALAINPDHVGVLEYYGEWHVKMGNAEKAQLHLTRIEGLCGVNCVEYRALENMIANPDSAENSNW